MEFDPESDLAVCSTSLLWLPAVQTAWRLSRGAYPKTIGRAMSSARNPRRRGRALVTAALRTTQLGLQMPSPCRSIFAVDVRNRTTNLNWHVQATATAPAPGLTVGAAQTAALRAAGARMTVVQGMSTVRPAKLARAMDQPTTRSALATHVFPATVTLTLIAEQAPIARRRPPSLAT